jgi:hypothetical protein
MSVYTTTNDELCCPACGEPSCGIGYVAVDNQGTDSGMPSSRHVPDGTGYRVALFGLCRHCRGRFTLMFTTHKGVTYVEAIRSGEIGDQLAAS